MEVKIHHPGCWSLTSLHASEDSTDDKLIVHPLKPVCESSSNKCPVRGGGGRKCDCDIEDKTEDGMKVLISVGEYREEAAVALVWRASW